MILERGMAEGELRPDLDVEATAHALQATLLGHQRNLASDRPIVAVDQRRDLDALIELLLNGLRAPQSENPGQSTKKAGGRDERFRQLRSVGSRRGRLGRPRSRVRGDRSRVGASTS